MDYEVFILARVREEYDRTGSTREAVVGGLGRTGRLAIQPMLHMSHKDLWQLYMLGK